MAVSIPALTPEQHAVMFAPPTLSEYAAAARDQGFIIDLENVSVGATYRHDCGGEPIATYTKTDDHSSATYATCACGALYCMYFEVWT